ncbi:MAG: molybdate ABC transporter substrate-binding protein [Firmicutes bacterium HGW-Firmicutes-7]|nr:MAG: molybdate ABC transporter substrate-binding protein [Firmicutes bacterium HGW-Firmicutes-7]
MRKRIGLFLSIVCLVFSLVGCNTTTKETTITLAAAASLKNCMDDKLIPMFQEKYPNIKVISTYDSSGKLQTQIEEGAAVDVFMSAAMKQMSALNEKGLIAKDSIVQLLENKIVLIATANSAKEMNTFEDILKADILAVGDPDSVPAGQYAKEVLTNLDIWDKVSKNASFGTNVTQVLNWVAEGSADVGIVYATDAASNNKVKTVAEAPEGTVSKVIYPVGIVKATENEDAAKIFIEFLKTDEAKKEFESYGFTVNK